MGAIEVVQEAHAVEGVPEGPGRCQAQRFPECGILRHAEQQVLGERRLLVKGPPGERDHEVREPLALEMQTQVLSRGDHALAGRGVVDDGTEGVEPVAIEIVPEAEVAVLLLPTSGPWMKLGEAAEYVRAVQPQQIVQIHEMLLSDIGLGLAANLLGERGLTGLPLAAPAPGDSLSF